MRWRPRPCFLLALSVFASTGTMAQTTGATQVAEVQFDDLFLQHPGGTRVDVSRFEKGNVAAPGSYRADLYVNTNWIGRAEITLRQVGDSRNNVQPCFDRELLQQVGVDLAKLSPEATHLLTDSNRACATIGMLVPDAVATFDNGEQRLDVSIPQASLSRAARGYVDPRYWDEGVPAALLSYNGNVYRANNQGTSSTQAYLGLTAGLNVGPWRFRHNGNYTYDTHGGTHYQSVQTSLQRSIARLKAQLVIGDAFTDGTMFDSVGFRGVRIASDERMYPESQRGYAPTIHGIANSNALVQVRQNGNIIYSANVATGPFEIDDLYATGYGGDLDVVVTEADGSIHTFKVPYASAVNSLRPGITRFSVTAGQYRSPLLSSKPALFQATVQHGFTNLITGYGGMTAAPGYVAGLVGAALNTELGAFAFDVTQANTDLPGMGTRHGQSVKLSYSKLISPTNTNIAVAAYRYSSSGYLGLQDAMQLRGQQTGGANGLPSGGVRRGQFQVMLNQGLPDGWGSFYLSGSTVNYWNRGGNDTQFQAGYNNNFRRINYGVSAARQFDATQNRWDNRFMLNVSIPLNLGSRTLYSSTSLQRDSQGATLVQQSLTGSLGVDNALSYGVNVGRTSGGTGAATNVGGNVSYMSPYATVSGNASKGTGFTQYGGGISGGMVAYAGGVAFAPTMGETMAIVEAKDANGARVTAGSGLRIDSFGHALVPSLTPFSTNEVEIDPKGVPMSVELKSSAQHVAPTAGAVVRLKYETEGGGRAVIMRVRMSDGEPVPFGAEVNDAAGQNVGTVAQDGRIVLRGVKTDVGTLNVKWGDTPSNICSLSYTLPMARKTSQQRWTDVEAVCTK
ncbi:Fimbrial biogenesis outer membrane usher protein [Burkholderia lata]|uniref:Fimbrial biogenesis outer membrane usher protein n=1 Tax=Burkholderia lata (strain ATCC 17760 / DSM 23089 / LMG 22485 / NCIMB 9086 / R18194 / 383) TaxID=482957 RepID=A0A6P3A959_BURL3|nr:fimbria/pilus outer membrane usher protein [Burkholderia lata]VWD43881.1 Fimbrial biogenesis outer membrane usher protein [Burkholderia lata]